ncbi:TetR family transcriptional regulator [Sediminibacillus dalangtanensis]|uniref:TetR family transcriptional regulator n=1 Tax=Sediminibacillus dalangtanensis TaxID=2729421 RepID=A0ABX7VUD9_9BACI|nr:TetR family transcriptional regulator C-terminal domain-containing protein [Sediminibacillus dalangtanensis]QTN00582.1 TetR family transcriptional regulator [Sediminibacillus dalangtanensis]
MPKKVNHEQRRNKIAEAAWRVILENGMEGATVRKIAEKAGLSLGALRYYFSNQEDLILYSMRLVKERASERIERIIHRDGSPKQKMLDVLLEIVPTNKQTRAEMEVWFTFVSYARYHPHLLEEEGDGILAAIQLMFEYMETNGLLRPGVDRQLEIERLYAMVDGLALHAMLEPERLTEKQVEKVIASQLEVICE